MKKVQNVIIDTNFWLLPYEKRVDIFGGIEDLFEYSPFFVLIPSPVIEELKMMAGQKGRKNSIAAKSAIEKIEGLLKEKKAKAIEREGKADGVIISLALEKDAWVCTNDKELRRRLKQKRIRTIILRDEHKLKFA